MTLIEQALNQFNCYFYLYQLPRNLVEIDANLGVVSAEITNLLQEVHS